MKLISSRHVLVWKIATFPCFILHMLRQYFENQVALIRKTFNKVNRMRNSHGENCLASITKISQAAQSSGFVSCSTVVAAAAILNV